MCCALAEGWGLRLPSVKGAPTSFVVSLDECTPGCVLLDTHTPRNTIPLLRTHTLLYMTHDASQHTCTDTHSDKHTDFCVACVYGKRSICSLATLTC